MQYRDTLTGLLLLSTTYTARAQPLPAITVTQKDLPQLQVLDGDTIRYKGKKFRLVGIDTPETNYRACGDQLGFDGRPWGREASRELGRMVQRAHHVQLLPVGTDRYKRTLAFLLLYDKGDSDGELAQCVLTTKGLATSTVRRYGHHGQPELADLITEGAKTTLHKPRFQDPHEWRKDCRQTMRRRSSRRTSSRKR